MTRLLLNLIGKHQGEVRMRGKNASTSSRASFDVWAESKERTQAVGKRYRQSAVLPASLPRPDGYKRPTLVLVGDGSN